MAFITWTEALETGVSPVDGQHRHLVNLINSLEEAVRAGAGEGALQSLFAELVTYTKEHFQAEEELMEAAGYPALGRHKLFHDYFTKRLSGFVSLYNGADPAVAEDLLSFLKLWFLEHVTQTDHEYVPYVVKTQA